MGFRGTMYSKSSYYRRLRRAKILGCSLDELPDGRGKHGKHRRASAHPRWNERPSLDSQGYVLLRVGKSHPLASVAGYAREHDVVMVAAIGRALTKHEMVHHINGDKTDNRLDNLELMTRSEHTAIHLNPGSVRPPDLMIREFPAVIA